MRSLIVSIAAALLLAGCNPPPRPKGVVVTDAWVRLPAVPGRPGAAYFTIKGGASGATLVAVSSPRIDKIELHESMEQGGMMRMTPIAKVIVPPDGTAEFKPAGRHAMLFGIDPDVKPGTKIPLRFDFESGLQIQEQVDVVGAGETRAER